MSEESQLWNQLRRGQHEALKEIYNLYWKDLFQYGSKIAAGDTNVAQDCVQELFIKIWESHDRLGPTDNIKNYLFASLRRRIYKTSNKSVISTDPTEIQSKEREGTFEEFWIQDEVKTENAHKLRQALQEVSPRQREVIYLRFYQNMEYEEICEVMDISYQGARNMLFKAIKSMKKHLGLLYFVIAMGYKMFAMVLSK